MHTYLRPRLFLQFIYLLALGGIATLFIAFLEVKPLLRMDLLHLLDGVLAAFLAIILIGVTHIGLLLLFGRRYQQQLAFESKSRADSTWNQLIGLNLVCSSGEELLFRCLIFKWALNINPIFAYSLNALFAFMLNLKTRRIFLILVPEIVAVSFYASVYQAKQSYFLLFIAHFLCSLFWDTTLRGEGFEKIVETICKHRNSILNRPKKV